MTITETPPPEPKASRRLLAWKGLTFLGALILTAMVTSLLTSTVRDRWDSAELKVSVVDVSNSVDPIMPPSAPPPWPIAPMPSYRDPLSLGARPWAPGAATLSGALPSGTPRLAQPANWILAALSEMGFLDHEVCETAKSLISYTDDLRKHVSGTARRETNRDRRRKKFLEQMGSRKETAAFWHLLGRLLAKEGIPKASAAPPKFKYPDFVMLENGQAQYLSNATSIGNPPDPSEFAATAIREENLVRHLLVYANPDDIAPILLRLTDELKLSVEPCEEILATFRSPPPTEHHLYATVVLSNAGRDSGVVRNRATLSLRVPASGSSPEVSIAVNMGPTARDGEVTIIKGLEATPISLRSVTSFETIVKDNAPKPETAEHFSERIEKVLSAAQGAVSVSIKIGRLGAEPALESGEVKALSGTAINATYDALRGR